MKQFSLVFSIVILLVLCRHLYPLTTEYYSYHDVTQSSRIAQYTLELTRGHIPPMVAPDYAYGYGYPVFTYYAPAAYLITSLIYLVVPDVHLALQMSYSLAILLAYTGMYRLARRYMHGHVTPLLPATLYASSPWIAVEIFVRGNIAETWLIALLPWMLIALTSHRIPLLLASLILSLTWTVHNALSPIALLIATGWIIIHRDMRMVARYVSGLMLSVWFWVPFAIGIGSTYAQDIAKLTRYSDHYLCLEQLWTTLNGWGYGGSVPGCIGDGMSYMIGKVLVILSIMGVVTLLLTRTHEHTHRRELLYLAGIAILSAYMTIGLSWPVWTTLTPLQGIQFPWRFVPFIVLGCTAIVSSLDSLTYLRRYLPTLAIILSILSVALSARYFVGQGQSRVDAYHLSSSQYTREEAAYAIPEYLPRTVDPALWQRLRGTPRDDRDLTVLQTQIQAYSPPNMVYTVAHVTSLLTLLTLIWLTLSPMIRKKA